MKSVKTSKEISSVDVSLLKAQCWDLSKEMIRHRDKATAMANRLAELNKMIEEAEQSNETAQADTSADREV